VIGLLQSKKRCLRRFLEVSEQFAVKAEQGDLSGLASLEVRRERSIKTLGLIDRKITETVRALAPEARTRALSQAVRHELDDEVYLVQSILSADNRIMNCIEVEKQRLAREMASNRKSHDAAGRFRSTWVPEAGEGLDQKA